MQNSLVEIAYTQALKILHECKSEIGFKASALETGYPQVWGRDSMITTLGALATDDKELLETCKRSLAILKRFQTYLGLIPDNIDVHNENPAYHAYMDGNMWFVVGVYALFQKTADQSFLQEYYPAVEKILTWLSYQDVHNTGLISMQEAGDWQDFFSVRGRVLYDNALYCIALQKGSELARKIGKMELADVYEERAKRAKLMANRMFWVEGAQESMLSDVERAIGEVKNGIRLEEEKLLIAENVLYLARRPYFIAFRGFRQSGDWFDSFGNMLAILSGIADKEKTNKVLDFAAYAGVQSPYPIKAIYPPVFPGDREWREYYKKAMLNYPYQYHNGGIWPFLGGFYVAALVRAGRKEEAEKQLEALAKANQIGKASEWEFNEWLHGMSGYPMGKEKQAWSAGMYVFAYHCVKFDNVPLL